MRPPTLVLLLMASYLCECVDAQFTKKVTFCRVRGIRLMTLQYCSLWLQLKVSLKIVIAGQILLFSSGLVSCILSTHIVRKFISGTDRMFLYLCRSRIIGYLTECASGLGNDFLPCFQFLYLVINFFIFIDASCPKFFL